MPTTWTFDDIENSHDVYRSKDCIKKISESLGKHIIKIINFKKKKMIPLTNEEHRAYLNHTNYQR